MSLRLLVSVGVAATALASAAPVSAAEDRANLDRLIEAWLTQASPDWLIDLTTRY